MTLTPPSWETLGRDWPHRACSHFVETPRARWHVQQLGSGPPLLLLHGTGGATFTWAALLPRLAERWHVIAPDLPGHGFTTVRSPEALGTRGMAAAVAELLQALGVAPVAGVGHSAGAVVLLRLHLDGVRSLRHVVGLAPALLSPPATYRLLVAGPLGALVSTEAAARLAARWGERPGTVERLLEATGSPLARLPLRWYRALFREPAHVGAGLAMMSRWQTHTLADELARDPVPLTLVAGARDGFVPLAGLRRIAPRFTRIPLVTIAAGHLLQEEAPDATLQAIDAALDGP